MPLNYGVRLNPAYGFTPTAPAAPEFQPGANVDPNAQVTRADGYSFNPTAGIRPEFQAAGNRVALLNQKKAQGGLTKQEADELAMGLPPEMYQGSTFNGQKVNISSGANDIANRGSAFLLNDPDDPRLQGLSTKRMGQFPTWQSLQPGTHYNADPATTYSKTTPSDVQFQRRLNEGPRPIAAYGRNQATGFGPSGFNQPRQPK